MKPTYPVRGFLHSLIEGSTDIEEAEEVILGFIDHAQERAWKEGFRVGTTHNPYRVSLGMDAERAREVLLREKEAREEQSTHDMFEGNERNQ